MLLSTRQKTLTHHKVVKGRRLMAQSNGMWGSKSWAFCLLITSLRIAQVGLDEEWASPHTWLLTVGPSGCHWLCQPVNLQIVVLQDTWHGPKLFLIAQNKKGVSDLVSHNIGSPAYQLFFLPGACDPAAWVELDSRGSNWWNTSIRASRVPGKSQGPAARLIKTLEAGCHERLRVPSTLGS